jgi:hypothetical protein
MNYYIKERHNPQIGIYYKAYGKMTKKEAKKAEESLCGYNIMWEFKTEKEYLDKCAELKIEPI